MSEPLCTKCAKNEARPGQRWCRECHAEYQRENRRRHSELSVEARRRANARSYLNVYVGRGLVIKQPCVRCGATENLEGHHDDYSKPLEVVWYCVGCHHDLHHPQSAERRDRITRIFDSLRRIVPRRTLK